jgi:dihydropteroate synthase
MHWLAGRFCFDLSPYAPVIVMGIVNVTPDSFSDGGQFHAKKSALNHAERLISEGASILDVGGESTRPGAAAVSAAEEIARILPVIIALVDKGYCVSVDTRKPEVMREALKAGASIVNDVMALSEPGALEACAASDCGVVLMHMRGSPETMQVEPHYDDVIGEVGAYLVTRAQSCEAAGIARYRIVLDPGFGFGKTLQHNLTLTQNLDALVARGYPVLAGWSRKKTIGTLTGRDTPSDRIHGSVAAALACVAQGAHIVRVHDVAATVDALKVWRAMAG